MSFAFPKALQDDDDAAALGLLQRYFGPASGSDRPTGAMFDTWDTTGSRKDTADRFTADDCVAVTCLSVDVRPIAAHEVLVARQDELSALLARIPVDRDLVDVEEKLGPDSAEWQLNSALRSIHDIGRTVASKLMARKRPRLIPVHDVIVAGVTNTLDAQWEPLRLALRADGRALHERLTRLRDAAGLPDEVSALRVLDVIAWREGKDEQMARHEGQYWGPA